MIEQLEEWDRWIVLSVNSWHSGVLDELFWWISQRIIWIPLYLILTYLAWIKLERRVFITFLLCAVATVVLSDLISVHLFKNIFLRYRPSHYAFLTEQLHFYRMENGEFYKGGMYGFISSHAANFFSLSIFVGCALRTYYPRLIWIMLGLALMVSFSRLYQGVHYASDLFAGAVVGGVIGYLLFRFIFQRVTSRV